VVVAVAAMVILWPISALQMPVSQDHINHYFSTQILAHDMIPSGRFFGWTDRIGTGYPFGDLYATPAYMATAFLHIISFQGIDLHASYAFGIVLAWLIPAMAITAWTKRLTGNWGATFAGLAFLLDTGGDREGGWIYSMFHGVWPQQLGTGVWLFALLALWRLTEKMTTRRLGASVALAGISLWIHPMNSVTLLTAAVIMFSIRLLMAPPQEDETKGTNKGALRLIFALIPAGLIGLTWALRMILAQDVVYAYPAFWSPLMDLVGNMLEGNLFAHQIVFVGLLAIIGAIRIIREGGRFNTLAIALPAVLLLIGSLDFLLATDLGLLGGKLGIMQYSRFSIAIKPLWYALAGVGLTVLIKGIAASVPGPANRKAIPLAGRAFVALLIAPVGWAAIQAAPTLIKPPVALPLMIEDVDDRKDFARIADLLEKEKSSCAKTFCRAVYYQDFGRKEHGGLYPVRTMADANYGWLPTRVLPANNFRWLNHTNNPDRMARLGASLVISRWEIDHSRLTLIEKLSRHFVYRVNDPQAQVEVAGPGTAEIISWDPESKKVAIADSDRDTTVTFLIPPYRKWHALQNGNELEIKSKIVGKLHFMQITGITDGILTLNYTDSTIESLLSVLSTLILLACFWGIIARPRTIPTDMIGFKRLRTTYSVLTTLLGLLAILLVAAAVVGSALAVQREWLPGKAKNETVLSVIHRDGPLHYEVSPKQSCIRAYVRDPGREHHWDCSTAEKSPKLAHAPKRRGRIPSCLSVTVPKNGTARLTLPLPGGTGAIRGYLHQMTEQNGRWRCTTRWNRDITATMVVGTTAIDIHRRYQITPPPKAEEVTFVLKSPRLVKICIEAIASK
jgi:hypothetical protein